MLLSRTDFITTGIGVEGDDHVPAFPGNPFRSAMGPFTLRRSPAGPPLFPTVPRHLKTPDRPTGRSLGRSADPNGARRQSATFLNSPSVTTNGLFVSFNRSVLVARHQIQHVRSPGRAQTFLLGFDLTGGITFQFRFIGMQSDARPSSTLNASRTFSLVSTRLASADLQPWMNNAAAG